MNIQFDNNIPIYLQIIDWIKHQIISSAMEPGSKLPSVRELAEQMNVNPNTVQRAYREIETEELCQTKRGMGSFITTDKDMIHKLRNDFINSEIMKFTQNMNALGVSDPEIKKLFDEFMKRGKIND